MAKQLSLFGENPKEAPEKTGGFRDFLPPELHDFGRLGRLTLIIAYTSRVDDRQVNNDFIRYLMSLGFDRGDWNIPRYLPLSEWLSLKMNNRSGFICSYPRPMSLITESKRIELLINDCHFTGCARIRSAYNAFINLDVMPLDADIFTVERATNYMKSDGLESFLKAHGASVVGDFLVTNKTNDLFAKKRLLNLIEDSK